MTIRTITYASTAGEASVARANASDDMDHEMSSTAAENLTNLLDRV